MKTTPLHYSTLEVMLLAMVQRGMATTYDLQSKVGLSVGATSRALKRLQKANLLTSKHGPRGSQRFAITTKGEEELERGRQVITREEPPVSLEDAIRILYLGWLFNEPRAGSKYAKWAADELRGRAKQHTDNAMKIRESYGFVWQERNPKGMEPSVAALAAIHRWLKNFGDAKIALAEADLLEEATAEIERLQKPRVFLAWSPKK